MVEPVEILDFYHGAENLTKARNAIFRDPEGRHATSWYERWRRALLEGRVEELIAELEQRRGKTTDPQAKDELRHRTKYFQQHAHRMRYDPYQAEGLPIGSGAVEGTCKNLIKGRRSCVGQRWGAEHGIERMTALRVRIFNERYDDLWKTPADQLAA